jgi:hypothetical protein
MKQHPFKYELLASELLERSYLRKWANPLEVLATSKEHANRMDEEGTFWSLTLSTDISKLRKLGVGITKEEDPFTSVRGYKAHFKRYRLADEAAVRKAIELVNKCRAKRGVEPLSKETCARYLAPYQISKEAA